MLASFPASMVNQKSVDLGIPNRFSLISSRFSHLVLILKVRHLCRISNDEPQWPDGSRCRFAAPRQGTYPAPISGKASPRSNK
jgi:hypothetical protein